MKIEPKNNEDPLEKAFIDFFEGKLKAEIIVHSNKGETEEIPIAYFFRTFQQMPLLEKKALALCSGDILDIGAGSGSHSLFLQEKGERITALDIKAGLVDIMKRRGIGQVVNCNIYNYKGQQYDTLLMLMNGIGFTGDFNGLDKFLKHARHLLKPGGKIILDSSDILYLYEEEDGSYLLNLNEEYYGELDYNYEYHGLKGDVFKWLFIDFNSLKHYAQLSGFDCELVYEDVHFNYLAVLTFNKQSST